MVRALWQRVKDRTRPAALILAGLALGCHALVDSCVDAVEVQNLPEVDRGAELTDELRSTLEAHELELPSDADNISYTIVRSLDANKVGVRFETSRSELYLLLEAMGTVTALRSGFDPWRLDLPGQPDTYGWDLPDPSDTAGLVVEQPYPGEYRYAIVVDESQARVVVYLEAVSL